MFLAGGIAGERIGELAKAAPRGATAIKGKQGGASVDPPKHERLGLTEKGLRYARNRQNPFSHCYGKVFVNL